MVRPRPDRPKQDILHNTRLALTLSRPRKARRDGGLGRRHLGGGVLGQRKDMVGKWEIDQAWGLPEGDVADVGPLTHLLMKMKGRDPGQVCGNCLS